MSLNMRNVESCNGPNTEFTWHRLPKYITLITEEIENKLLARSRILCPARSQCDANLSADHPPIAVEPINQSKPDNRKPTNMTINTMFHHLLK
jgi:hypothetical protein